VKFKPAHALDVRAVGTNHNDQQACNAVVNIYARTRLHVELTPAIRAIQTGAELSLALTTDVFQGNVTFARAFGRLAAPARDLKTVFAKATGGKLPRGATLKGSKSLVCDPALLLAQLEKRDPKLTRLRDEELHFNQPKRGAVQMGFKPVQIAARTCHVGVYLQGYYCPIHNHAAPDKQTGATHHSHATGSTCDTDCVLELFSRVLTTMLVLPAPHRSTKRTQKRTAAKR